MTYKIVPINQLSKIVQKWTKKTEIIAPVSSKDGLQFQLISNASLIMLNTQQNPRYPPKALFLPQSETLFRYQDNKYKPVEMSTKQRAVLGIRPCDARALWLLDTIFSENNKEDPYWTNRRNRSLIISVGCNSPRSTCFCTAVGGSPFGIEGSDVLMTEVDGHYLFKSISERGTAFIADLPEADNKIIQKAQELQSSSIKKIKKPFKSKGLRDKLYSLFDDDFWAEISQSCLGCGVCTFLCPTCYCFDIVDEVQRSERVRNWDTCMFRIYSQEASGHNPRPTKVERTRQRVMHKFAYWIDNINEFGCTGCGRCIEYCPVNLDIRQILRSAQMRKTKAEVNK